MTGTALVLARDTMSYTWAPSLIAWWTGSRFTEWHIAAGAHTRCGRPIPPALPGYRLTRRHHPAAHVCGNCLKPNENPAAAVTATGQDGQTRQAGRAASNSTTPAKDGQPA